MARNDGPQKLKAMFPLGVAPKKKGKAAPPPMAAEAQGPPALSPGLSILKLRELISPPNLKTMLLDCRTKDLRRYVMEITGQEPHPMQDDHAIIKHLCKWIDGDKNWAYATEIPTTRKPETSNPTNHTHEEGAMKTKTEKKQSIHSGTIKESEKNMRPALKKSEAIIEAAKKEGTKILKVNIAKAKVAAGKEQPEAIKPVEKKADPDKIITVGKVKKEKKGRTEIIGKVSGKTRPQFLIDLIIANAKAKKTDEELLAIAQKELGKENVPGTPPLYTIGRWRWCANYPKYREAGKFGLTKSLPKFIAYGK